MFSFIRFSFYFTFSFIILSIPYQKKPLFNFFHDVSSPYTKIIFKNISTISKEMKEKAIQTTSGLIEETIPRQVDKISSSLSSMTKEEFEKSKDLNKREQFFQNKKRISIINTNKSTLP